MGRTGPEIKREFHAYMESASIHGMYFIGTASGVLEKLVWITLVVVNLFIAGTSSLSRSVSLPHLFVL